MGNWVCSCGMENDGRFCTRCGKPMPQMTSMPNQQPSAPPQGAPPRPQGAPPRPQGMPPRPQGMPPRLQGAPPRPQGMPPQPPYGAPIQPQYAPQNQSGNNNGVLIALIVVLVVVIAGVAFYFLHGSSDDNGAQTASSPSQVTENNTTPPKEENHNPTPPPTEEKTTPATQVAPISMGDISSVSASSEDHEGGYVHSGNLTIDGNVGSCWSEGVPNDVALGSYLVYNFADTRKVSGIRIWIGHQKSADLFRQNARPSAIQVQGSDGSVQDIYLNDKMGVQSIKFGKPMEVNNIKLTVKSVFKGSKYSDTCIAEVQFF